MSAGPPGSSWTTWPSHIFSNSVLAIGSQRGYRYGIGASSAPRLVQVIALLPGRYCFRDLQECVGRVREARVLAIDQAQLALDLKLLNGYPSQLPARDLRFD